MRGVKLHLPAFFTLIVIQWLWGGLWYGALFSQAWMTAVGKSEAELQAMSGPIMYVVPVVGAALEIWLLNAIMQKTGETTVADGLKWGALLWLCFIFSTMWINNSFSGSPFALTLIDSAKELGGLLICGAVLGAWRPKAAA
ncbi:MAG: DUF1761 domain-containing protein [bacterium]